jgi:predicted metal-dependent HD superfamily phosphohydrolase
VTDLQTIAIETRQALQLVQRLADEFDKLSDPHFAFKRHVHNLHACASLLTDASASAHSEARIVEAAAKRRGLTDAERAQDEEAANRG